MNEEIDFFEKEGSIDIISLNYEKRLERRDSKRDEVETRRNNKLEELGYSSDYDFEDFGNETILNEGVFQNMINDGRIYEKESLNLNIENHNLLWYLREYSDGYIFTKNIFMLENELFDQPENERDIYLFKKILQF